MTNSERQEFERRKTAAEKQLNEMYYGTSGHSPQGGALKMPPFLSTSRNDQTGKNHRDRPPQSKSSNRNPKPEHHPEPKSESTPSRSEKPNREPYAKGNGLNLLNMLNFKSLGMDHDRMVILALCLLLSGEEADELLLLALIYIML